jgi:hypothetical protein
VSDRPEIKIQIAITIPIKNQAEPIRAKIQPRNSGGSSSPGFAVPRLAANTKMAPIVVEVSAKKEKSAARPATT